MKILENKIICIILMISLIAGGLFIGGMKGLNRLYGNVEDVFFAEIDKDGICVANDMAERVASATNMTTIADKYGATASAECRQAVKYVKSAASSLNAALSSRNIDDAIAANKILDASVADLYREMGDLDFSGKDNDYRQSLYADFNSRNDTISHDSYNQYAAEYMQVLDDFPADLIASVMPVKTASAAY